MDGDTTGGGRFQPVTDAVEGEGKGVDDENAGGRLGHFAATKEDLLGGFEAVDAFVEGGGFDRGEVGLGTAGDVAEVALGAAEEILGGDSAAGAGVAVIEEHGAFAGEDIDGFVDIGGGFAEVFGDAIGGHRGLGEEEEINFGF